MLKKTDVNEVYHVENIPHEATKRMVDSIKNISDEEKEFLIENSYIAAGDAQYINVWEIYNEEFAKLVWTLPRGNDEAEERFRKQIGKK
jgi:hypothetical protein